MSKRIGRDGKGMPQYTMRNRKTGEEKDLVMTVEERGRWLDDNPDWYQPPIASRIVGGTGTTVVSKTDDGWKDVLKSIKKASGYGNTIKD